MSKSSKIVLGVIVIVLLVLIATLSKNSSSDVIKIGYFGPLTGPAAGTTGEDVVNAIKMANTAQNVVANRRIEIIYEDDACDPQKAVGAANKLINIDKVNILINGVCSGSMVSVAPITESHKKILFTTVSESPKITNAGDYVFRISASSVLSAHAMVQGLAKLNINKVGIIFENAEYTTGMKEAFVKEFSEDKNNVIVATESFNSKDTDLRTQLAIIGKNKMQILVVFANSTVTANIVANQLKEMRLNVPLLGNTYYASEPARVNPNNEGNYAIQYKYDSSSAGFVNFLSEYKKRWGKTPAQDIYSVIAYDGYNILFNAIKTCAGDNPDCIKNALYSVKNYQGIGGVVNMDENGDTQREFVIKKIHNGETIEVK